MLQSGPFAAGDIDRQPSPPLAPPIEAPRPLWDAVARRAQQPAPAARIASEESRMQRALWDRHQQIETLLGRPVPRSVMMTGQAADRGMGALSEVDYEARIEEMRREFPQQLAAIESRGDLNNRLSGRNPVSYYETPLGRASAITRPDGSLWLETADGVSGPLSRFAGARPVRRVDPGPRPEPTTFVGPRERSLGERFTSTVEDAARRNPLLALGRWAAGGGYDEFEDPETGQTIRYANFGQQARDHEAERRDAYDLMTATDGWAAGDASLIHKVARGGATFAGVLTGSAVDPINLISPGRTVAGRIVGGVAVNAAGDAVTQAADVGAGLQEDFNPAQTAIAGAVGGVLQGGIEVAGAVSRAASGNPGGVVEALANEIEAGPRTPPARELTPLDRAALARIDRDRLDAARVGPVVGARQQEVQKALDDLRAPIEPSPTVERDIDELIAAMPPSEPAPVALPAPVEGMGAGATPDASRAAPEQTAALPPAGQEAIEYQGRRIVAGTFDPMRVGADPATFQYKASGDEGLTDRLSGVTSWDRTAAGRTILYEDRAGNVVVADGHQRRGLARRLIESGRDTSATLDGFLFRQADGWEPREVRIVAALKNIREGAGTILDAAKVFREAPGLVNDRTLPVTGDFIASARGLARLSDDAFGAVTSGVIPERYGAVIGEVATDRPDLHLSMVDLMRQGEPRSLDEARAYVKEAQLADFAETNGLQADLFGDAPLQSTLIARSRLRAAVLKSLRGDARLFSSLIRNADAIEAGGNALARSENEMRVARDMLALNAVDRLSLRVGQVGDSFGAAATAITRGDLTTAQAARDIIAELRQAGKAIDEADLARMSDLAPAAPGPDSVAAVQAFDRPGGAGQTGQITPKPEDVAAEAQAGSLWDDLPEAGEEQKALDLLRVCAPVGG